MQYALELKNVHYAYHTLEGETYALKDITFSVREGQFIALVGPSGCGKSTLAHTIAKRLDFYEMDVEDYYFPEQKNSRQAVLEQQYDVKCEYKG